MVRDILILGASGLAREMAVLIETLNARQRRWRLLGFVGGSPEETGRDLGSGRVLGDDDWLLASDLEADLVAGVGYPGVRARVLARYLAQGDRFGYPNLIHPAATFDSPHVRIGRGNVITAGVVISCDITIADFNLFNWNATIGHDDVIGSYNVINPGSNISGGVRMGDRVLAGTGCQVLENLTIGSDATIGAGAVVRNDVAPGQTVVGVPARPVTRRD